MHKRFLRFIQTCNGTNACTRTAVKLAMMACHSCAGNSLNFIADKYNIDKTNVLETQDCDLIRAEPPDENVIQICTAIKDFMTMRQENRNDYTEISEIIQELCEQ